LAYKFRNQTGRGIMYGELKVFAGSSHPTFVDDVCRHIGIQKSPCKMTKFANDNMMVQIQDNVRGKDVYYIQTSVPPVSDGVMEMLIALDALKHASAARITAVIPYMPYVRSDKKDQPRISIAARLMADLLETAGAHRVITMDLHAAQIQGFFRIPVDHLRSVNIMANHFKARNLEDTVVVASDVGELKETGPFANRLNAPIAIIDKRRSGRNDDKSTVRHLIGEVAGKDCLLIDDEVATAGTLTNAAAFLKENGARSVRACATHAVLCGQAIQRINDSALEELVFTNSIPLGDKGAQLTKPIKVLSVAGLFGDALMRIHNGDSISVIFDR
jgi:ribose-phosphate pyrophosphokinase